MQVLLQQNMDQPKNQTLVRTILLLVDNFWPFQLFKNVSIFVVERRIDFWQNRVKQQMFILALFFLRLPRPGGEPGIFLGYYFLSQMQCLRPLGYCAPYLFLHYWTKLTPPGNFFSLLSSMEQKLVGICRSRKGALRNFTCFQVFYLILCFTIFLSGLVIDDVRVVLVGLGCQASKASVARTGWQPNPSRTCSYCT